MKMQGELGDSAGAEAGKMWGHWADSHGDVAAVTIRKRSTKDVGQYFYYRR
jgi:hypothetical protein